MNTFVIPEVQISADPYLEFKKDEPESHIIVVVFDFYIFFVNLGIATTIIHPATEKHIKKWEPQPLYIIEETPEFYKNITEKSLKQEQFTLEVFFFYNKIKNISKL